MQIHITKLQHLALSLSSVQGKGVKATGVQLHRAFTLMTVAEETTGCSFRE